MAGARILVNAAENPVVKNTPAIVAVVSAVLVAGMVGYAVVLNEQTKAKVAASQEASARFAAEQQRLAAEAEEASRPVPPQREPVKLGRLTDPEATEKAATFYAIQFCEEMSRVDGILESKRNQSYARTMASSRVLTQLLYGDGSKPEFLFKANSKIVQSCPQYLN